MSLQSKLDHLHAQSTGNKWMRYFTTFCRLALAAGFIPSGFVKINGERFTSLSNNHPMGAYLEALFHTEWYYSFIGIAQVTAALLLLIPRTAVIGAMLYFPIILNICLLSLAVRFDGSLLASPLMVIANVYLLCWYYDRWKYVLPFNKIIQPVPQIISTKFPVRFFAMAAGIIAAVVIIIPHSYNIVPHNHLQDCKRQCPTNAKPGACNIFCECIHNKGEHIDKALERYEQAAR